MPVPPKSCLQLLQRPAITLGQGILGAALLFSVESRAKRALPEEDTQTSAEPQNSQQPAERHRGLVFVTGQDSDRIVRELAAMFPNRSMDTSLQAEFESAGPLTARDIEQLGLDRSVRFVALLDVSDAEHWRLLLYFPKSSRALTRTLPGAQLDRAALEAVISVIVSANEALQAGHQIGTEQALQASSETQPAEAAAQPQPNAPISPRESAPPESAAPAQKSTFQLELSFLGEPTATPHEYGLHWSGSKQIALGGLQLGFGPSLYLGLPSRERVSLGRSEFHTLQLGIQASAMAKLSNFLDVGLWLEPFAQRQQITNYASRPNVTAVDPPTSWTVAGRAGLGGWLWLSALVGLEASGGVSLRPQAPVLTDSQHAVLLTTTPVGWFIRTGILFRIGP